MLGRWRRRLRYWLHGDERARLLREEMEAHLEMKARELMEDGMAEGDARNAARRQFGNLTLRQEESRGTWIARWLSDLVQDAAFGARAIRKQPGFTAAAVLSAALGIGACSMIFGIANFALFRPLPVSEPSQLMSVSGKNVRRGKLGQSMAYPDFVDLRQARSFEGMAAFFQFMPAAISRNGEPQRYWGSLVTANYFDVVRPGFVIGQGFDAARDDAKGEAPVVVLSYQLWRSRFGGDRSLTGRDIELNGRKVRVAGVTGPGFQGTETAFYSDFWLPFSMMQVLAEAGMGGNRLQDRDGQWLLGVGRLREGASEKEAAAEMEVIGARLRSTYPATNQDRAFHVERAGQVNAGFRKMIVVFFLMLLGVATLVLCTSCANVANLLLARASARHREIATRLAIGAGRGRLVRQLLTESVMLALLGGMGGYAIAYLGAQSIGSARIPLALPVDFTITLDYRVMLFCMALSTLTGVVFGLVPALRATRPDLVGALKDEGALFGRSRLYGLRNLLVVAQVSICMVLLICSGLFLRSLNSAQNIETGLAHRNVLLVAFDPSLNHYAAGETRRVVDAILEGAQALPGVESASLSSSVPLSMEGTQNSFTPEDRMPGDEKDRISADIYSIAPGFFETLGIRMIEGEDFRVGVAAEDVVIVNQPLADKAFPKQSPVGRRIRYFDRTARIVGLVATTKSRSIGEDPHSILYFPMAKDPRGNDSLTGMTLLLRTRGNPAGYATLAREMIRKVDPALALFDVRTMEAHLSQALFAPRAAAWLFGFAGFMGLLISTVGIYGVISYAVARQTKEIGIRMALGARRTQVLARVLQQGLLLTAAGSSIGLGAALALSRIAGSLLYGVSATDTLTFVGVPVLLVLIALMACLAPAKRAASLDPIRALRYE
jgi:macrolide transport system ATP-binding/permease protein